MKLTRSNILTTLGIASVVTVSIAMIGCSSKVTKHKTIAKTDGHITVPFDYLSWQKFVSTIDKSKTGQVREIYMNTLGLSAKKGGVFPSGTVTVMEIYAAKKMPSGELLKSSAGKLVKGKLSKVFVMEKGSGWASKQAAGTINNGDWSYGAYLADAKTPATKNFAACRSCHAPLSNKDYIFRYDEHFNSHK